MRCKGIAIALLLLVWTTQGLSYTRPRFEEGPDVLQPRWAEGVTIPVVVNIDSTNIEAGSQPFEAVRNAFETRSAYADIRFAVTQTSIFEDFNNNDGVNLVTFKDTAMNRSIAAGFGAVAHARHVLIGDELVIVEMDIVFNPDPDATTHSTTGAGEHDIEGLCSHEVTHVLRLEHSAILAASAPSIWTPLRSPWRARSSSMTWPPASFSTLSTTHPLVPER